MSKNKKIVWGIVGIVVLVGVFYGGVSYGKGQTSASPSAASAAYGGRTRGAGGFGGMTVGQIIAKDATSITVQLMNVGTATSTTPVGSKIVYLDSSTPITKQVSGTLADLTIGTNVSVTGTADASTGSISATAVQIRPNLPAVVK
jgi:hypothetical protein